MQFDESLSKQVIFMDPLENIIRFRLAKISNESFLDYIRRHPNYEALYNSALEMNSNEFENFLEMYDIKAENPEEEMLQDFVNQGLLSCFNEIVSFENMVNSHGSEYMVSLSRIQRYSSESRKEKKKLRTAFESRGMGSMGIDELDKASADFENYFIPVENYVMAIKDSAHKIGIERALQDESRFSVIREIHPNPESYDTCEKSKSSYKLSTFGNSVEACNVIGNSLDTKKGEEKILYDSNELDKCLMRGIENMFNVMNELSKDYTKEKIGRIYKN